MTLPVAILAVWGGLSLTLMVAWAAFVAVARELDASAPWHIRAVYRFGQGVLVVLMATAVVAFVTAIAVAVWTLFTWPG